MSAHGNLVVRCALKIAQAGMPFRGQVLPASERLAYASAILAEVSRTLERVTKEMDDRGHDRLADKGELKDLWLAMLRASPLTPP